MNIKLLAASGSFLGGLLMMLEYIVDRQRLMRLELYLRNEFGKIKSFRLPKLKSLSEHFAEVILSADGEFDEADHRLMREHEKGNPYFAIVMTIVIAVGISCFAAITQQHLYFLLVFMSPLWTTIVVWSVFKVIHFIISVLERGPKGIVGTVGFILFFTASCAAVYLSASE